MLSLYNKGLLGRSMTMLLVRVLVVAAVALHLLPFRFPSLTPSTVSGQLDLDTATFTATEATIGEASVQAPSSVIRCFAVAEKYWTSNLD